MYFEETGRDGESKGWIFSKLKKKATATLKGPQVVKKQESEIPASPLAANLATLSEEKRAATKSNSGDEKEGASTELNKLISEKKTETLQKNSTSPTAAQQNPSINQQL